MNTLETINDFESVFTLLGAKFPKFRPLNIGYHQELENLLVKNGASEIFAIKYSKMYLKLKTKTPEYLHAVVMGRRRINITGKKLEKPSPKERAYSRHLLNKMGYFIDYPNKKLVLKESLENV